MTSSTLNLRPLFSLKPTFRKPCVRLRLLSTTSFIPRNTQPPPARLPFDVSRSATSRPFKPRIKTYPPPPSTRRTFPHALNDVNATHLATLDPNGFRQRFFARDNPNGPHLGDTILVVFKSGDPFGGVLLSIRRRGPDTGILLRNRLMMTGVEMWVKVFSPNVRSVEVVQRAEKRARRARLFYMRKPKHDRGSVQNMVDRYRKQKRVIRDSNITRLGSTAQGNKGAPGRK